MTQKATLAGRQLYRVSLTAILAVAFPLLLVGCGEDSTKPSSTANPNHQLPLAVNSPENIVNESADNYDDNVNGLITAATLQQWQEDWLANRPAAVTGKLVIIQQSKGNAGAQFIASDNKNVLTYNLSQARPNWFDNRSSGVVLMGDAVPSGASMDALLKAFGIDVNKDLIVCAQGQGTSSDFMNQGRCWFTFSYWGVPQERLAVLNGNNATVAASGVEFADEPSSLKNRQVSSVKDLRVDNSSLHASLGDVLTVAKGLAQDEQDADNKADGILLWDARNLPQYSAGEKQWSNSSLGNYTQSKSKSFQNSATRQSHPRGALNLEFTNLIDTSTGEYPAKEDLWKIVKGEQAGTQGHFFVDGAYTELKGEADGGSPYQPGDTVIAYCETSMRAGVTIIATGVILGIPTRLYDAAMQEWNSLTAGAFDQYGKLVLPANSPWDTSKVSYPQDANGRGTWGEDVGATVAPRSAKGWAYKWNTTHPESPVTAIDVLAAPGNYGAVPLIVNAQAEHTNNLVEEDRAYKAPATDEGNTGGGSNDSNSGGGPLVTNPCG